MNKEQNILESTNDGLSTKPAIDGYTVLPAVPSSDVYLEDCVKALKRFDDKHFDLAVVDPPYMDGDNKALNTLGTNRLKFNIETLNTAPKQDYFDELFRVSKNQIVWGGNYFTDYLRVSRCWLMWDKIQDLAQFSDFELACTSFDKVAKKYKKVSKGGFLTNGTIDQKIHPTQKPVGLYSWIFKEYAKEGDLILDTHVGSGSSRIAADLAGLNYVGFEISQEFYDKQEKRFNDFKSQLRLF